ncbi:hypothetical protein [Streptomyces sp. NPDC086519]|uniref:hypothetical protein n=1 Tax=Streptomyces sp. NPDC086519 TaxID=3154863 RepID=UPI003446AB19
MTTAMRITGHTPERPKTDCALASRVSGVETQMITEMAGAAFHLERLQSTVGTPEQELAAYKVDMTADRHRDYVLGVAARIRRALDTLTAPYETPADTDTGQAAA